MENDGTPIPKEEKARLSIAEVVDANKEFKQGHFDFLKQKAQEKVESLISPEKQELMDFVDSYPLEGELKEEVKQLVIDIKNIPDGFLLRLATLWKANSQEESIQNFEPRDDDHLLDTFKKFTKKDNIELGLKVTTLQEIQLKLKPIVEQEKKAELFA